MTNSLKDKIIIRNYTNLSDFDVICYIQLVIKQGKCSETKQGKQYSFVTLFKNGISVYCNKRKETYTFYITKED